MSEKNELTPDTPGSLHPAGSVIYTTECRRCKDVVPVSESEYHDAWEKLCRPCYAAIQTQER